LLERTLYAIKPAWLFVQPRAPASKATTKHHASRKDSSCIHFSVFFRGFRGYSKTV